jgi:multiple sugar transport system substrate-binding protein
MNFSKTQMLLIGGGALIVLVLVLLFTGVIPGLRDNTANIKADLIVWGVFDPESAVRDTIISDFATKNKNIRVLYEQKNPATYEQDLVNALAAGTGPDVFFFKNTWLPKHGDKLLPFDQKSFPVQTLESLFPRVVAQDFARDGRVYALPLYVDTLALFYNRAIFDNANIPLPPTDWKSFENTVRELRRFDQNGRITKAAAAIGGSSRSINEATDLLSLIMLQGGSGITTNGGNRSDISLTASDAVAFYTGFANPRSRTYTWDSNQHYSLDAFAEENVAMIFNYAYQIAAIKAKNPFLQFKIAPIPQPAGATRSVNYASYWGLGVSNRSKYPAVAFDFIRNATLDPAVNGKYLNAVNRPPALLTLIEPNLNDPDFGVFVRQSLTATSWKQPDASAIDTVFARMIDLINSGQLPLETALRQAEEQINALINRRSSGL